MPQSSVLTEFSWKPRPEAAAVITSLLDDCVRRSPEVSRLSHRLRDETGTRLRDWVDHFTIPDDAVGRKPLAAAGFEPSREPGVLRNTQGMFPPLVLGSPGAIGITLHVESVPDFLIAMGKAGEVSIQ